MSCDRSIQCRLQLDSRRLPRRRSRAPYRFSGKFSVRAPSPRLPPARDDRARRVCDDGALSGPAFCSPGACSVRHGSIQCSQPAAAGRSSCDDSEYRLAKTRCRKPGKRRRARLRHWKLYRRRSGASAPRSPLALSVYFYVPFRAMIDARLARRNAADRSPHLRAAVRRCGAASALTIAQMIDRLNDLGYAHRARVEDSRANSPSAATPWRAHAARRRPQGRVVRVVFGARPRHRPASRPTIDRVELPGTKRTRLDAVHARRPAPHRARARRAREAPRRAARAIPQRMVQAVLAIEDRRFYDHPGIDPIGIVGAVDRPTSSAASKYLRGGSTITQQLVQQHLPQLDWGPRRRRRRRKRKLTEWFMSIALERAAVEGPDPRAVPERRVARPARIVRHPRRAGSGAAVLRQGRQQRLARRSGDDRRRHPVAVARCRRSTTRSAAKERRNVVLQAMADAGYISAGRRRPRRRTSRCSVVQRALDAEAPYFVDYVEPGAAGAVPGDDDDRRGRRLHDARPAPAALAQDAVRDGLTHGRRAAARKRKRQQAAGGADRRRSAHRRDPRARRRPLLQPVAVQPRDRRAAPAGIGVQAVRLSRRVRAGAAPKGAPTSRRPRSSIDEPTTFEFDDQTWTPANYDGRVRRPDHAAPRARALAQPRDDQGRARRPATTRSRRCGRSSASARRRRPYPSIALGVFEATPFEIATAYTLFPNGGTIRPLRAIAAHRQRRQGRADRTIAGAANDRAARTRRSSSPT